MAFIVGVVTLSTTWKQKYDHRFMKCQLLLIVSCRSTLQPFTHAQLAASGIWHGLQAIAECLIMCTSFLNRCEARLIVLFCNQSFLYASAAEIPHWYEEIRLNRAPFRSQRRSNWTLCNDLVTGSVRNLFLIAKMDNLHNL